MMQSGNDLGQSIAESPEAEQINKLENDLQAIMDKRLQERFYYVTGIVLLLDAIILPISPSYFGIFACGVEAVIFLALADRWGVEQIGIWTRHFLSLFSEYFQTEITKYKSIIASTQK